MINTENTKVLDTVKTKDKAVNRAYNFVKGVSGNPKGRPKGSTKENKTKNILQDAFIKRRKEVSDMKFDSLAKLTAGFVPKEDILKHTFELPALSITTQGDYKSTYKDFTDAEVVDPVRTPIGGDKGEGGSKEESLTISNKPILDTLTNCKTAAKKVDEAPR